MLIISTMCKLIAAMGAGYYMRKKNVFNQEFNSKLSTFVISIACPCLIVSSISKIGNLNESIVYQLLILSVGLYLFLIIFSAILVKILKISLDKQGVYRCMFIFSNCAFMGIPVCQSFFGESAAFYVSILHLPYNILLFSYGKQIIFNDKKAGGKFNFKQFLEPGIIAAVIALFLFFSKLQLPIFILEPLYFLGDTTTPLSMVIIGSSMAGYQLSEVLLDKKAYFISFIRLIVLPLIVYGLLILLKVDNMLVQIATMTTAMPVGSLLVMLMKDTDSRIKEASYCVVVSTLCSMVTIPFVAVLLTL